MRIGIDFHSAEREGTGNCTYIRNLIEHLLELDIENEYFLYVSDLGFNYYKRFKNINNIHLRAIPIRNPLFRISLMGLLTYKDKVDVLHVQYNAPFIFRGKLIVSIHDITYVHYPQYFRKYEVIRQNILIPINIKKADKILTLSNFSKDDIVKNYHADEKKIEVIYLAANPIFSINKTNNQSVLAKYGILGNFILSVGRIDARKNIESLIRAFVELKREMGIKQKLVLIGREDYLTEHIRNELFNELKNRDIVFAGYVQEEDLPVFYNFADVFVYPSRYEGFGLPCLEAMACGCPVIASNVSSLSEIIGDAGVLVNPLNIKEIASSIYNVISDNKLRGEMITKGLKQVNLFSWRKTAEKTLDIYKSL